MSRGAGTRAERKFGMKTAKKKFGGVFSTFAVVLLAASALQAVAALGVHVSKYTHPLLLCVFAAAAVLLTVVAAVAWKNSAALRKTVRTLSALGVGALLVFGIFETVRAVAQSGAEGDILAYVAVQNGTLLLMYLQMLLVFAIPVAVAAASQGGRADRVILRALAVSNAAIVLFFTAYGFDNCLVLRAFDILIDFPLGRWLYFAYTLLVTVLTFFPALSRGKEEAGTGQKDAARALNTADTSQGPQPGSSE